MYRIPVHTIAIAVAIFVVVLPLPEGRTVLARSSAPHATAHASPAKLPDAATGTRVRNAYAGLPLRFEAGGGSDSEFIARGAGYLVGLAHGDAKVVVGQVGDARRTSMAIRLVGALPAAGAGRQLLPGVTNYLTGNEPRRWKTGVRSFGEVEYRDVYRGVNVVYYGNHDQLEFDFLVSPGASYRDIRIAFDGASDVAIDADGNLVITTAAGQLRQHAPVIYQEASGSRRLVTGGYVRRGRGIIGFRVGAYDARLPLVIDPVLTYSSYLGGAREERAAGVAVDAQGNMYIAGLTGAADFPLTGSPAVSHGRDNWDVFVAKINARGDQFEYVTYLGGTTYEEPAGLAVDAWGHAFVTGHTESWDFPTVNALQPSLRGFSDSFVVKLETDGTIAYATYFGGGAEDYGTGIAVDDTGRAYVSGQTGSADFPTANAFQPSLGGSPAFRTTDGGMTWVGMSTGLRTAQVQAFAIDPVTSSTVYAGTYSGVFRSMDGGQTWTPTAELPAPSVNAMLVDSSGALYIATLGGVFRSRDQGASWTDLQLWRPASSLAVDAATGALYAGVPDFYGDSVFISVDGGDTWSDTGLGRGVTALAVSQSVVYAGTSQGVFKNVAGNWAPAAGIQEPVTTLAVDPGNADVAYAGTWSGLFTTTSGGSEWSPVFPWFVGVPVQQVAIAPSNPMVVYVATWWGAATTDDGGASWRFLGNGDRPLWSFAIDPLVSTTVYAASAVGWDVFVSRFSADGSALEYSTYFGGSNSDSDAHVALDPAGNAYIAGTTASTDLPLLHPLQDTAGGLMDVFVAKFTGSGRLGYATYLAGGASDYQPRIGVDAAGRAHVTGTTLSRNFPTANAYQPSQRGESDVFVTTLNETGDGLVYSTFLGGSNADLDWSQSRGPSLAVWPSGETVITGTTDSIDFPTRDAMQGSHAGGDTDAFVTKFGAAGNLEYSTFLGGSGDDYGSRVAIDATGGVIVAGATSSADFPALHALQPAKGGSDDVFVARLGVAPPPDTIPPATVVTLSGTAGSHGWFRSSVTADLAAHDDIDGSGVASIEYSINGSAFQRYAGPLSIAAEGVTTLRARAIDHAGNIEEPATVVAIMIDATPPALRIDSPAPRDYRHTDTVPISFEATDAVSGLAGAPLPALDGVVVANGTSIQPLTLALGAHTLSVSATDLAGNTVSQTIEFRMSATIDSLAAAVNLLVTQGRIHPQLSASLRAKLDEARQAVTRGNVSAAHGLLHAFGNQIAAQSGGTIEPGAANILLADVQYVAGAM